MSSCVFFDISEASATRRRWNFLLTVNYVRNEMSHQAKGVNHRRAALFLLPALFAPTSRLRVAFHRLRGADIGDGVELGYEVLIDNLYPERVHIANDATVSARSTILAHDEAKAYAWDGAEVVADTYVGARAFLGVASVVLPGITIGPRAIIGAGSVVTRDVPAGTIVIGAPAKELRTNEG
jgi:acetyltransferase-like isoleucine patch superfamily enzyme